ncbi:g9750 [Coccomyxa elongata]
MSQQQEHPATQTGTTALSVIHNFAGAPQIPVQALGLAQPQSNLGSVTQSRPQPPASVSVLPIAPLAGVQPPEVTLSLGLARGPLLGVAASQPASQQQAPLMASSTRGPLDAARITGTSAGHAAIGQPAASQAYQARPTMQQTVVQNHNQWGLQRPPAPTMSQPGSISQYQSYMAGGQPVYRPAAPQAAMQPSMAHTPPVQQQRPLTEEDRHIIPKRSIERLATTAGGGAVSLSSEAEAALMEMAEDWLHTALVFGCASARKRGAEQLAPSDLTPYFERTWNLHVPGFGSETVQPYKRVASSELHRTRTAAVRRTIAETSAPKSAPAQAPAPPAMHDGKPAMSVEKQ